VGEYLRTGLDYDQWVKNFQQGVAIQQHARQMRIDFTLTLPGLFEIESIERLAQELGVDILSKVIFSFTPDIILSPLSLPRSILSGRIDRLLTTVRTTVMRDMLLQLQQRPTFQEQWPDTWQQGLVKGKRRILCLEQIRQDTYTIDDILEQDPEIYEWWQSIGTDPY
jgi:hypothetical protein